MPLPLLPSFPWPTSALAARLRAGRVMVEELEEFEELLELPAGRARRPPVDYRTHYSDDRGLHRVFASAAYRLYRKLGSVPVPGVDSVWTTATSLPTTPGDTFADGTWFIVVTYYNGLIESPPRVIGPNGETYAQVIVSGGSAVTNPPQGPTDVRLEVRAGGVIAVIALYDEDDTDGLRADDWVISATYDGSTPAEDPGSPTDELAIPSEGVAVLEVELPAQADGTAVKVRVQTRRDADGGGGPYWSDGSTVLEATADAAGPSSPPGGVAWRGSLPEGA